MKVRYVGESFYDEDGLTDGKIYKCVGIEGPFLRIVDDSGEDYLYSLRNPGPLDPKHGGGKWEIVEDDENETLRKTIEKYR